MLKVYAIKTEGADAHDVAYTLLRWKYEELWGGELPTIARKEGGKPFFVDSRAHFSISHTKTLALCALSDGEIGLDAELVRPVAMRTARRILSQTEWLQYSCSHNPAEMFMTFWTLKEAYVKYTGVGLSGMPQGLSFDLSGLQPKLAGSGLYFWTRRVDDHVISLCADEMHRPEFYLEEI